MELLATLFDIKGTCENGSVGSCNFSQPNVRYAAIEKGFFVGPSVANGCQQRLASIASKLFDTAYRVLTAARSVCIAGSVNVQAERKLDHYNLQDPVYQPTRMKSASLAIKT